MFWQNRAIQAVPSACSKMTAGGQRRAAVEHADIVETQEAALKHVLAEAVLAVHPPGEVEQQLIEGTTSGKSTSASPRRACSVRWRNSVAQAWTGGFTSLKFHS